MPSLRNVLFPVNIHIESVFFNGFSQIFVDLRCDLVGMRVDHVIAHLEASAGNVVFDTHYVLFVCKKHVETFTENKLLTEN